VQVTVLQHAWTAGSSPSGGMARAGSMRRSSTRAGWPVEYICTGCRRGISCRPRSSYCVVTSTSRSLSTLCCFDVPVQSCDLLRRSTPWCIFLFVSPHTKSSLPWRRKQKAGRAQRRARLHGASWNRPEKAGASCICSAKIDELVDEEDEQAEEKGLMNGDNANDLNSHRPLQMVHAFESWAGTTEKSIREKIRGLQEAGLGGLVTNVNLKNYLRDVKAWTTSSRASRLPMMPDSGSGSTMRRDIRAVRRAVGCWSTTPRGKPKDSSVRKMLRACPL